jgi:hypothetical protein
MVGEQLARDQNLAPGLIDVGVDRKIVLVGEVGAALKHLRRAALRGERSDRPMQGALPRVPVELVL